ncbi:MAG: ECF transporter S component [Bacillota bacterium]|jgi:hypothetical protein|nr:ECF transporter S component [Bacillota bacterium]HHU43987.1 ECF transporter S component [Clostridiales bacterium]
MLKPSSAKRITALFALEKGFFIKKEEMKKQKFWQAYKAYDLVLMAMLAAISIAFKTIAGVLIRMITGPLGIPGGALAGGLYMLWLPLGLGLVGKKGAALIISAVQAVVLLITGMPGSHGVWTILTYLVPPLLVEVVFLFQKNNQINALHFLISTTLANIMGSFGSNLLFFRLSFLPLMLMLSAAALSGSLGGIIGYLVYSKVKGVLFKDKSSKENE